MRIAQLVILPVPDVEFVEVDEAGDRTRRTRLRLDTPLMEPRIRVSAIIRWQGRVLGRRSPPEYRAGGRSRQRRDVDRGAEARAARRVRGRSGCAVRGTGSIVNWIAPKMLIRRNTSSTSSSRPNLSHRSSRGALRRRTRRHRILEQRGGAEDVVCRPIERFLSRWQPGDPAPVYLGHLGALSGLGASWSGA